MTGTPESATKSLVLLSGGQDSAVCLAWALTNYAQVETLGFSYGQRHSVELECRPKLREAMAALSPEWAARLGPDHVLDLSILGAVSDTALTSDAEIAFGANGLPNTFVPGRNLLFFTLAAALGYRRGIRDLVGGMCQTDYSGYPDCRDETLQTLASAINLGTDEQFRIVTPLMWRTKAETWAMTHALGGNPLVDIVAEHSHTCYKGDRDHRHEWGYGCGTCPACDLRAKGYYAWRDMVASQQ
ncbi:7-cyano-7-deazaguanine synthase [Rhodomicrobium udaipurense JA643]|uniref:7-cyano-7-deazaguanine synthase n=1 Tax=Rhodomicrobium udaipurense TaxID=1202716 RepID=A0A8I1KJB4_9HYPH|nr:7-cyano-7-deazaguanine synthase QueC [Rhodomicrobium udaipurense]KAI96039.1 7-cyano-7-deazaguanine synthase [Rhodomicrobium udaipurense JA643]MBJ7542711.1 7-cyano-7-deazaguanine synthase QueC [Rhodomicrobium udaipurense]